MENNFLKNAYYLLIKNDFFSKDFDEALLNLLLIVLKKKNYQKVTDLQIVVEDFKEIIGFDSVNYMAIKTIWALAKKKGYVYEREKETGYFLEYTKIVSDCKEQDIKTQEKTISGLKLAFYTYLTQEFPSEQYNEEKAEKLIDSFIDSQGAQFYKDKSVYFSSPHDEYLFASFLSKIEHKCYYDIVDSLITGRMLSELLVHKDDIDNTSLNDKSVYLDAGIIFYLLDVDELERGKVYRDFVNDIQELGMKVKVFKHTMGEVTGIISNSVQWVDNIEFERAYASRATCYFIDNGWSKEDIEELVNTSELKIEKLGITIEDKEYPQNTPIGVMHEQDYYDKIVEFYDENSENFDEEEKRKTIECDAKSFFYVSSNNNFNNVVVFSGLNNILLTSNTSLAIISKQIVNSDKCIPFCVTDTFFGMWVWKNNHKMISKLSQQNLSNFIYNAFNPSPIMQEKFSEIINKCCENQTLDEEECITLRQNKLAAEHLMKITQGDINRVNEKTAYDVMQNIKKESYEKGRIDTKREYDIVIDAKDKELVSKIEENAIIKVSSLTQKSRILTEKIVASEKNKNNLENLNQLSENKVKFIIRLTVALLSIGIIGLICLILWIDYSKDMEITSIIGFIAGPAMFVMSLIVLCITGKSWSIPKAYSTIQEKLINKYHKIYGYDDEEYKSLEASIRKDKETMQSYNFQLEELKDSEKIKETIEV